MSDRDEFMKNRIKKSDVVRYPSYLLKPVSLFLKEKLRSLIKARRRIKQEDPFEDVERLATNASPDDDASEQVGHARVDLIRKELDRKIIQTKKALARIKIGKYGICESCGKMIDTDRLMVYPEATLCAKCQAEKEK